MSFYIKTTLRLQSSPIDFIRIGEELFAIDASYTIYRFNASTYKSLSQISLLGKSDKNLHSYSKLASLSGGFDVAVSVDGSNKATLITKNGSSFAKKGSVSLGEKKIVANLFSKNGKYFVLANESGEVNIYDTATMSSLKYFEKRQDFVCSMSFSQDSNYLFLAYFDKTAIIYDIYNQIEIGAFETASVIEQSVFIEDGHICIYATRDGHIGSYDYLSKRKQKEQKQSDEWISSIAVGVGKNFVFFWE